MIEELREKDKEVAAGVYSER